MLKTEKFFKFIKNMFTDRTYGRTLEQYIIKHHPKNSQDIEILERKWQYRQQLGGHWI